MPLWAAWTGWALGILFGLLSAYQALSERQTRRLAMSAKAALRSLRDMINNAVELNPENIDLKKFAYAVGPMTRSVEANINAILGLHRIVTLGDGKKYVEGDDGMI
jgi:hypothetical protein